MSAPDGRATGDDPQPRPLRATDDERRRVADELSEALGRGQIDLSEFDERTNRAWAARTRDELADPLADLVDDPWAIIMDRPHPNAGGAVGGIEPFRPASPAAHRPPGEVAGPSSRDLSAVAKAHVTAHVISYEQNVKSTLAKVSSGDADAAVVYRTDVKAAGDKVTGVPIASDSNVRTRLPIATWSHNEYAKQFVQLVTGAEGRKALSDAGFGSPD